VTVLLRLAEAMDGEAARAAAAKDGPMEQAEVNEANRKDGDDDGT
jgi:hypothetical protein